MMKIPVVVVGSALLLIFSNNFAYSQEAQEHRNSEITPNTAEIAPNAAEVGQEAASAGEHTAETKSIKSKLEAAEKQGVGTKPYRAELDRLVKHLDDPSTLDKALAGIKSLEAKIDDQLSKKKSMGVQYGNLTVYTSPPAIKQQTYSQDKPPVADMVNEKFEGYTSWYINPNVDVRWNDDDHVVSTATVIQTCNLTVYLPVGCSLQLKKHEDGHVKICTDLYEKGHLVTRELANRYLMGRPWNNGKANEEFQAAYRKEVLDIITWLNKSYDSITNHGLNPIDSNKAVGQAFELCYKQYRPYLAGK